jgi:hypothetical protein
MKLIEQLKTKYKLVNGVYYLTLVKEENVLKIFILN